MSKFKPTPFTSRIPVITHKGDAFRPDFLLAFKDGKTKICCMDDSVDIHKITYQVDCYLDLLKDLCWADNQRKVKKCK